MTPLVHERNFTNNIQSMIPEGKKNITKQLCTILFSFKKRKSKIFFCNSIQNVDMSILPSPIPMKRPSCCFKMMFPSAGLAQRGRADWAGMSSLSGPSSCVGSLSSPPNCNNTHVHHADQSLVKHKRKLFHKYT